MPRHLKSSVGYYEIIMINRKEILEKFKNSSEFYRKKLESVRIFEEAPLTQKSELVQNQIIFPPYGNFIDPGKSIFQIYRTSGTTAQPLLLSFTRNDIDLITDIGSECFRHSGMGLIGNSEVVINCLNLSMWAGGFFDSQAMMKTGVQVVNFGTGNTIELLKLIFSFSSKFKVSIHCTPSYLPILEDKLKESFHKNISELGIYTLYLGAEGGVQNNDYRNSLIEKWQCRVYNANYGMSEVCSIMGSASDDNILKFSDRMLNNYFMEIMTDQNDSKDAGSLKEGDAGDMIITSLRKESQPLFRYFTNEKIRIMSIHKTGIYFEVIGRSDDMIVYKGINFYPEQIRSLITQFKELTGIYKVEVSRKNEIVESINLVCELKKDIQVDESKLRHDLSSRIRNEFTIKLNVNFVYRFDQNGNKHRMVEYI